MRTDFQVAYLISWVLTTSHKLQKSPVLPRELFSIPCILQIHSLERLCKACRAAITDGGLYTDTGVNERGENERQSENDSEMKTVSYCNLYMTRHVTHMQIVIIIIIIIILQLVYFVPCQSQNRMRRWSSLVVTQASAIARYYSTICCVWRVSVCLHCCV